MSHHLPPAACHSGLACQLSHDVQQFSVVSEVLTGRCNGQQCSLLQLLLLLPALTPTTGDCTADIRVFFLGTAAS